MPDQKPNEPYDFLHEDQKPKKSLLPTNFSGPAAILAGGVVLIILIIILASTLLGKGNSTKNDLTDVVGRAQEINRINTLEQPSLKGTNTVALLVTSQTALTSEQKQLTSYASANKLKLDPKKLATYKNSQTDSQLSSAAQSNNLDSSYAAYLKQALNDYANSLAKAFQDTKKANLRTILLGAYNSTQTLLGNPPKS